MALTNLKVVLIFFSPFIFITTVVLNGIANSNTTLFVTTIGEAGRKYSTEIAPAPWAFKIWTAIYIWQFFIILFMFYTVFAKRSQQSLVSNDNIFPISFLSSYWLNFLTNIAWLFVFTKSSDVSALLPISTFILFSTTIFLYICQGLEVYNTAQALSMGFYTKDNLSLIWYQRVIVQNGLGIYLGWTSVAQNVNLSASLTYFFNVSTVLSNMAALTLLAFILFSYFLLDILKWDNFVRYLLTPYFVVVFSLSAVAYQQFNSDTEINGIIQGYVVVLLLTSFVLLVAKIIVAIWRHFTLPLVTVNQFSYSVLP